MFIENFNYISKTLNKKKSINLGINTTKFSKVYTKDGRTIYDSIPREELEWTYNGQKVQYFNKEELISDAYPSADLQKVIVVFDTDPYDSPRNDNAIILNGDGSFYMQLVTPELISKIAKERQEPMKVRGVDSCFIEVHWKKYNNEIVTTMVIRFLDNWWEERVLNPHTGAFGDCVGSGLY